MNAVNLNDLVWSEFVIPFFEKMNNVVLNITNDYVNWTYVIYGDEPNDTFIARYPERILDINTLPTQYVGDTNGDYCNALKQAGIIAREGTNDGKILISFNLGQPIDSECLDENGQQISFYDDFLVAGSFSTLDFSFIDMTNIENRYGNFSDCVYIDDFSVITFPIEGIYNLFYTSGDPIVSKFVGPISDYICFNSIPPTS